MNWEADGICILHPAADHDAADSTCGSDNVDQDRASEISDEEADSPTNVRTDMGRMKLKGAYKIEGIMTCPKRRSFQRTLPYVMVTGSNLLEYSDIKPPPDHARGGGFFASVTLGLWQKGTFVKALPIQTTETTETSQTTATSSTSTLSLHEINDLVPLSRGAEISTSSKFTGSLQSDMPGHIKPPSSSASPVNKVRYKQRRKSLVPAPESDGPTLEAREQDPGDSIEDAPSLRAPNHASQENLEESLEDESHLNEVSRKARQAVRRIKRQFQAFRVQEEKDREAWELVIQDTPITMVTQLASLDTLMTAFRRVRNSYKALRSHTDDQDLPSPISETVGVFEDLQNLVERLKQVADGSDAQDKHLHESQSQRQGLLALLDRLKCEREAFCAHVKPAGTAQDPANEAASGSMLVPKPHRFGAVQHSVMTMEALLDALDARYFQHCALAYEAQDSALTILTVEDFLEETSVDGTLMRQFDVLRNDMEIHLIMLNRAASQMRPG